MWRSFWLWITILCCIFLEAGQKTQAQTPAASPKPVAQSPQPTIQSTTQTKTKPTLERQFFKNILRDQKAIWTSPLSLHGSDALWLAPFGAGTALLIATDHRTVGMLDKGGSLPPVSRGFSHLGSPYWTEGIAASFYLFGRVRHDARARETGLLAIEALVDGGMVVEPLKLITQRPRPHDNGGRGGFFSGGYAFPSGHAMSAWALATVIDNEYGDRQPLVRIGAYSFATAVSLSRYGGGRHFISDALVGSLIGYGIGRYVFFKHHDRTLDSQEGQIGFKRGSKIWPLTTPYFRSDKNLRQYGITLVWDF